MQKFQEEFYEILCEILIARKREKEEASVDKITI
jgi:hypothetical protein